MDDFNYTHFDEVKDEYISRESSISNLCLAASAQDWLTIQLETMLDNLRKHKHPKFESHGWALEEIKQINSETSYIRLSFYCGGGSYDYEDFNFPTIWATEEGEQHIITYCSNLKKQKEIAEEKQRVAVQNAQKIKELELLKTLQQKYPSV